MYPPVSAVVSSSAHPIRKTRIRTRYVIEHVTFLRVITTMSLSNALPNFRKHALTRAHGSQQHSLLGGARHTVARRFRPTVRSLRSVPYPHHPSFPKLPLSRCELPPPAPRLPTPVAALAIPTPSRLFFLRVLRGRLLSRGCERDRAFSDVEWQSCERGGRKPVSSF